jgi:regulator of protease activity HflC (stomatin/prohibitin superfamily)
MSTTEGRTSLLSRFGILGIVVAAVVVIGIPVMAMNMYENVDAHEIMVVQSPVSGSLSVYTDSGWKWLGFGKYTKYPRRAQYSFSSSKDQGSKVDESIETRFNDGGTAHLSGVVSWDMPLDTAKVIQIHREFGSFEAIEQQLIRPMIEKVVYTVGPTMSSTESSAERRPEIPQYIDDQLVNGPYLTHTKSVIQHDPLTNTDKEAKIVEIVVGTDGHPARSAPSQITDHGIRLYPVTINKIRYNDIVEGQIAERQKATTQVQISQANARRAEQDAITTAKQGEANAAKAKWEQETINAKEIALAEKNKQVAILAAQQAEAYKQQQILEGQGDAEKKRLVINADGALTQKLETYKEVQSAWADAFAKYQGNIVPNTVFGGGSGAGANGAQTFMEIMTAKAAKDLNLDLSVKAGDKK